MFTSSTPDGLAPLSTTPFFIFVLVLTLLSIVWSAINFLQLSRIPSQNSASEKSARIVEMCRKIFSGLLGYLKIIFAIGFIATLIFFLLIMGALQKFENFNLCLSFLYGALSSVFCGMVTAVICGLGNSKIIGSAKFTMSDSHYTTKRVANIISFFTTGFIILIISLLIIIEEWGNGERMTDKDEIKSISEMLISYSFGNIVVAISCRIFGGVYAKGAEQAMSTISNQQDRLQRNSSHPIVICKAIGQMINKGVSQTLDFICYLSTAISISLFLAANNVIGTDQNGQIVFQLNILNSHLPILSILFSLFFVLLFNIVGGILFNPQSADDVRTSFKLQTYITVVFLIGFQSLASYLCLPAQFFIQDLGQYVKHPYLAYLCILMGMLICLFVTLAAQIGTNHPRILDTISSSCMTGSATNIIYGLSYGYLFNFIPFVIIAGMGYLSSHMLGAYGVSLVTVGFTSFLPIYLNIAIFYSMAENTSYISYTAKCDQETIKTLIDLARTRYEYEPHLNLYLVSSLGFLGFGFAQTFIISSQITDSISMKQPHIFTGLLVGAMLPYILIFNLIKSTRKVAPVFGFDLRQQIDEIPAMGEGKIDPDFLRTNQLYSFQCLMRIKRFFLLFFSPFLIMGLGAGPQVVLGCMVGMIISGLQLSVSSGISGTIWTVVKKQISMGNLKDEDMNVIRGDSEWGRASAVGSQIGLVIKDMVSLSIGIYIMFICLMSCVFGKLYSNIHS